MQLHIHPGASVVFSEWCSHIQRNAFPGEINRRYQTACMRVDCKHAEPRFSWNPRKTDFLLTNGWMFASQLCFWNRTWPARGAAASTGNYAGSSGDTSRSKQRIKVSGEEEFKALFCYTTCSKHVDVCTISGTAHQKKKKNTTADPVGVFLPHTDALKSCYTVWCAY